MTMLNVRRLIILKLSLHSASQMYRISYACTNKFVCIHTNILERKLF